MNVIESHKRSESGKNKLCELRHNIKKTLEKFRYYQNSDIDINIIIEKIRDFFRYEMTYPFSYVSAYIKEDCINNSDIITVIINSNEAIYGKNKFYISMHIYLWR